MCHLTNLHKQSSRSLTLVAREGLSTRIKSQTAMENLENEVLGMLAMLDADSLLCACDIVGLDVPEEKKGNQKLLLKFLLRKLNSEEVEASQDGGASWFKKLHEHLSKYFKPKEGESKLQPKTEMSSEGVFTTTNSNISNNHQENQNLHPPINTVYNLQRLRDFKINGSIGGPGERDKLSYTSLAYQIQNGQNAGFSEAEICAGVIKAIAPGNFLRAYLESKSTLNVKSLTQIMRSHFKEKDSSSTFTEMSNAVQSGNESPHDFVVRLLSLREKVLILAKEEGCPFSESLLQRRFLHAISTGLRNNNIRNDLRPALEDNKISDENLLQIVSEAVVNDTERHEKLLKEKKELKVNKVETVDNLLLDEIRAMKLEHSNELAAFRAEILQIKEAVNSNDFRRKRVRRCPNCTVTKSNCSHCFVCGSSDHQKSACPHDKQKN